MSLIEHLERDGWEDFFRDIFRFTLEILIEDRYRLVGSATDDLRSWLGVGGVARVRKQLNREMDMRRLSVARQDAVNECLEQLIQENQDLIETLIAAEIIPTEDLRSKVSTI